LRVDKRECAKRGQPGGCGNEGEVGVVIRSGGRDGGDKDDSQQWQLAATKFGDGECGMVNSSKSISGYEDHWKTEGGGEIHGGKVRGIGGEEAASGFDDEWATMAGRLASVGEKVGKGDGRVVGGRGGRDGLWEGERADHGKWNVESLGCREEPDCISWQRHGASFDRLEWDGMDGPAGEDV
jgi:hypothetical protein